MSEGEEVNMYFTINASFGAPVHNTFGQVVLYTSREAAQAALDEMAEEFAESIYREPEVVEAHIRG